MHRTRRLASAVLAVLLTPVASAGWDYVTPTASGYPAAVLFDGAGGVISLGEHGTTLVLARHRGGSGAMAWSYALDNGGPTLAATSLGRAPGGLIVAAGHRGQRAEDLSSAVVLVDAKTGALLWRVDLAGIGIASAATDATGDVFVAGTVSRTTPQDPYDQDLIALKLSGATGQELWRFSLDGGVPDARDPEIAREVRIDDTGDVYLAGLIVENPDLRYGDFTVLKLSGPDGLLVWQHTLPSVAGHGGTAYGVAIAPDGNVVATGNAVLGNGWCDIVVTKVSAEDGQDLWRYVLDSGPGTCDLARDVAVDATGDVLVAMTPRTVLFSVLKLSGASGTPAWQRDLPNGAACTGGGCAAGLAVSIDPAGDVIALGQIENGPSDMSVAKLTPADGSLIWRRDIDLAGCDDAAWALDVDSAGDVAVAGAGFKKIGGHCTWPQGANLHVAKLTGVSGKDFWSGCHDDVDNDGDGLVDLADPQCSSPQDTTEANLSSCGLGWEIVPALALAGIIRRQRKAHTFSGSSACGGIRATPRRYLPATT